MVGLPFGIDGTAADMTSPAGAGKDLFPFAL
jgi:hypothetical protein